MQHGYVRELSDASKEKVQAVVLVDDSRSCAPSPDSSTKKRKIWSEDRSAVMPSDDRFDVTIGKQDASYLRGVVRCEIDKNVHELSQPCSKSERTRSILIFIKVNINIYKKRTISRTSDTSKKSAYYHYRKEK